MPLLDTYMEIGTKRCFAGALDWPGWCRGGRNEQMALQSLFDYGPRYARILRTAEAGFQPPAQLADLVVREHLHGTTTTDFGAPDCSPVGDSLPMDAVEVQRQQMLLQTFFNEFDEVLQAAAGKTLRKGPRGGGREVEEIVGHIVGVDAAYLSKLGWKVNLPDATDLHATQQAILTGLAWAASGAQPEYGPRGGRLWGPRYFVRRVAWHLLDHLWEIEDRSAAE